MSEQPERLDKAAIQAMFDGSPFIATLGLEVIGLNYETTEITVRMPMLPTMERKAGTKQFHGGPLAAFIDTVGDFALGMMLGGGIPTINLRIDYLKPAFGDAGCASVKEVARRHVMAGIFDMQKACETMDGSEAHVASVRRGSHRGPLDGGSRNDVEFSPFFREPCETLQPPGDVSQFEAEGAAQ